MKMVLGIGCAAVAAMALAGNVYGDAATLTVNAGKPGAKIDPMMYGLMTEEINQSYDGGLYGELIQNRTFQDGFRPQGRGRRGGGGATTASSGPASGPAAVVPVAPHWSVVGGGGAQGSVSIDSENPVNPALPKSLRLEISQASAGQRVGIANDGFWGIPVRANTEYKASFYAKAGGGFSGPLTVSIESADGKTVYATGAVPAVTGQWQRYNLSLKTGQVPTTAEARFVISGASRGNVTFSLVSLFPPTFNNRVNGNRPDLMQILGDMKPAFLRFPGGNYLEGNTFETRFNWKQMIGPIETRPGHQGTWQYRSSDGFGLMEFLLWAEDLNMEPVLAVFAGHRLGGGNTVVTGAELKPYVEEALEEIEYVIGDVNTKWGAQRAKDGHPAPFKLRYVEIGNEENLSNGLATYDERFTAFYDAIKAKYPQLKLIDAVPSSITVPDPAATQGAGTQEASTQPARKPFVRTRPRDVIDDHYYMTIAQALQRVHTYDTYDRKAPKIFVGEWATRVGNPTPTLHAAMADGAFLIGLERNADVVIMSCYAPLLVNVGPQYTGADGVVYNPGMQWPTDLIGYNALVSFGSPSYYMQKMFNHNRGDVVVPVTVDQLKEPEVYATASREDGSGDILVKFVGLRPNATQLTLNVEGSPVVAQGSTVDVMTGELTDVNSVAEPMKVAPKRINIANAGAKFTIELPGNCVAVFRLKTK